MQAIPGQPPDCARAAVRPAPPFRHREGIPAQHVDVLMDERRKSGHIRLPDRKTSRLTLRTHNEWPGEINRLG